VTRRTATLILILILILLTLTPILTWLIQMSLTPMVHMGILIVTQPMSIPTETLTLT
jgi:uncharacterized protein YqfA (UPF0365 family)